MEERWGTCLRNLVWKLSLISQTPFGAAEITQYLSLVLVGVIYERTSFWVIIYDCTTRIWTSLEMYSVRFAWIPLWISACSIYIFFFSILSDIFRSASPSFLVAAQKAYIIGRLPKASLSDRKRISAAQLSSSRHNIRLLGSVWLAEVTL